MRNWKVLKLKKQKWKQNVIRVTADSIEDFTKKKDIVKLKKIKSIVLGKTGKKLKKKKIARMIQDKSHDVLLSLVAKDVMVFEVANKNERANITIEILQKISELRGKVMTVTESSERLENMCGLGENDFQIIQLPIKQNEKSPSSESLRVNVRSRSQTEVSSETAPTTSAEKEKTIINDVDERSVDQNKEPRADVSSENASTTTALEDDAHEKDEESLVDQSDEMCEPQTNVSSDNSRTKLPVIVFSEFLSTDSAKSSQNQQNLENFFFSTRKSKNKNVGETAQSNISKSENISTETVNSKRVTTFWNTDQNCLEKKLVLPQGCSKWWLCKWTSTSHKWSAVILTDEVLIDFKSHEVLICIKDIDRISLGTSACSLHVEKKRFFTIIPVRNRNLENLCFESPTQDQRESLILEILDKLKDDEVSICGIKENVDKLACMNICSG